MRKKPVADHCLLSMDAAARKGNKTEACQKQRSNVASFQTFLHYVTPKSINRNCTKRRSYIKAPMMVVVTIANTMRITITAAIILFVLVFLKFIMEITSNFTPNKYSLYFFLTCQGNP